MLGVSSWTLLGVAGRVGYPPNYQLPSGFFFSCLCSGGIDPSWKYFITQTAVLTCIVPVVLVENERRERKKTKDTQPLRIISVTNRLRLCAPANLPSSFPWKHAFSTRVFLSEIPSTRSVSLFPRCSPERCRFLELGTGTIRIRDEKHLLRNVTSARC